MGATAVTAFVHHHVQPAGGQHWKLFQGLVDEGQIRIDPRRAWPQADWWQTGLGEHPLHRSTIYVELPGDGGRRPFLDVEIAQDLSLAFRGDRHDRVVLGEVGRRFEGPGGGARTLDEQTAGSGIRTSGSAMPIALRQGKVKVRLLSPPSPVTPDHPVAVVVNPDASRSFAGRDSDGPVPHGPRDRGGSSGSADRRRVGVISGLLRTAAGTIDLTAVAAAANKHLRSTTDTHEQPGRRRHRRGLAHAWTTIAMLGIMPRHACSARCGARRRFGTWRFRSAPCLPIRQVVNAQLCARSTSSHLRRTPTCGYVDNASALPTDPQDQKTKVSVNLIAARAGRFGHSRQHNRSGRDRSSYRSALEHGNGHTERNGLAFRPRRRAPDVDEVYNE